MGQRLIGRLRRPPQTADRGGLTLCFALYNALPCSGSVRGTSPELPTKTAVLARVWAKASAISSRPALRFGALYEA